MYTLRAGLGANILDTGMMQSSDPIGPPVVCPDGTVLAIGQSSSACPGGQPQASTQQQIADIWSYLADNRPAPVYTYTPVSTVPGAQDPISNWFSQNMGTVALVGGGMLLFLVAMKAVR